MNSADRDLLDQAAALPARIEPERDLWPEIEARLDSHPPAIPARSNITTAEADRSAHAISMDHRWLAPLALAASLVLAAGVGYWAGVDGRHPDPTPLQLATELPPTTAAQPVGLTINAGLHQTRELLAADIETQLQRLPEDARIVVGENLAAINQALDKIDAVLSEAPETNLDQQLLMTMYADQLALLSSMHSVIRTSNQEILL